MTKVSMLFATAVAIIIAPAAHPQSPWIVTDEYDIALAEGAKDGLRNEYFEIGQWNIATTRTKEQYDEWIYNGVVSGPGVYSIGAHKAGLGDFNGDGKQDILINWATFPHTTERAAISPSIFVNEGGSLALAKNIWSGPPPSRIFSYKVGVSDFNSDGSDDAVLGSFGVIERLPDGGYYFIHERIPLITSEDGKLIDSSGQIAGQEFSVLDTFGFAHDLAVGDANGDGYTDFYQGRHFFLGDGAGRFTLRNDLIPEAAGLNDPFLPYAMSSALGDLDGDGVDDLVIGLADDQPPATATNGWIFLSNGEDDLSNARQILLPEGRFGLNKTLHNSMKLADVNGNGRLDILIGQTQAEPYYRERHLQLLVNKGDGKFVDETDFRLNEATRRNGQGEGITFVMDINGDGHVDIVDSAGEGPEDVAVLINNGQGIFHRIPPSYFPDVKPYHLKGFENMEKRDYGHYLNPFMYPIDLHGNGIASFIIQMDLDWGYLSETGDETGSVLYTLTPLKALEPVSSKYIDMPDTLGALSGSWYDPNRDGEGFIFEFGQTSEGPVATVYWFTHKEGQPYWLIGTTEYEQSEFDRTGLLEFNLIEVSGTGFGAEFKTEELQQFDRGALTILFQDCATSVAHWSPEPGSKELGDTSLQFQLQRITMGIDGVPCSTTEEDKTLTSDSRVEFNGALTGSWYDPKRDGEGFVFEFGKNPDSSVATAYWFTHRDGKPYWLMSVAGYLSDETTLDFDFLEVSGTGFGEKFDSSDIDISSWGNGSLNFSGCEEATASWMGPDAASGQLDLRRITLGLDNAQCREGEREAKTTR